MDIHLRKVELGDIEMIRNWRNSEDVSKYMYTRDIITPEMQRTWYDKISHDDTSIHWVIEYEEKPVGIASINQISSLFDSCIWAFYLGDTSIRGAGVGSKTEFNVINYVFETLNLNKLKCEVLSSNMGVISMHEKFGFRREAYYREHVKREDQYHDVVGLALLKKEWHLIKNRIQSKIYNR